MFFAFSDAKAKPIISTSDSVYCHNAPILFTAIAPGSINFSWNFGDNSGIKTSTSNTYSHTFSGAGTFIITLIVQDASLKYDTTERLIRIKPNVTANFNLDQNSNTGEFCISTEFSVSRWSDIKGFDSLHWDFGDGYKSKIFSPRHKYNAPGLYTITLDAYGFCGAHSTSKQIEIVADSRAKAETNLYVQSQYVCPGKSLNISAYIGTLAPDSMRIFTGDGKSTLVNDFEYIYANNGSYLIKSIAYNVCGSDTDEFQLNVTDTFDHQSYLYINSSNLCQGQNASLSISGLGIQKSTVDLGDGNVVILEKNENYLNHIYKNAGNYNVKVILEYECGTPDTLYGQFVVGTSGIVYPFSLYISNPVVCPNENVSINGPYIQVSDTLIVNYGDGTTETFVDNANTIMHQYSLPGNYTIKAKKINACGNSDSSSKMITVTNNATNSIYISSNYSSDEIIKCITDSIPFRIEGNNIAINNGKFWFSDGSSYNGLEIQKPFAAVGSYQVLATATDLCGNLLKTAYTIDIDNKMMTPAVNYWFQPLAQCVNQGFIFDNLTDNATKMLWDFGDGIVEEQPLYIPHVFHSYNKAGNYNVVLTASNGCGSTIGKSRSTVIAAPTIQFDISSHSIYKGDTVYFNNRTSNYAQFAWYFNYNENDSSTQMNVYRVYNQAGTFPVTMVAYNEFGCWDTLTKYINVSTMGINDKNGINQLTVYPNPANNKLNIVLNQANITEHFTVQIIDLNGKVLVIKRLENNDATQQLDISALQNGTYLLRVNNGKEIMHNKFVVIH